MKFDLYLALGDSISIDFYPAQDAGKQTSSHNENLGAASLLLRNDRLLFPEFKGQDLSSHCVNLTFQNLAVDGATTFDLLERLDDLDAFKERSALVTLTIGGNDLLQSLRLSGGNGKILIAEVERIQERFSEIADQIQLKLPDSYLILNTVYDPTDGTGTFTDSAIFDQKLPVELLQYLNFLMTRLSFSPRRVLCDIHKHFLGHGMLSPSQEDFWYWRPNPIEPGYRGASEIRRLWWKIVEPLVLF